MTRTFAVALALLVLSCAPGERHQAASTRPTSSAAVVSLLRASPRVRSLIDPPSSRLHARRPPLRVTLPARSGDPAVLQGPLEGMVVSITPLGVDAGDLVHESGADVHVEPSGDAFVYVTQRDRLEDLRVLRRAHATYSVAYRLALGPSLTTARIDHGRVELVDRDGYVRFTTDPAFAVDAHGVERALVPSLVADASGTTVRFDGDLTGLTPPIIVDPTWKTTSAMKTARHSPTLTVLNDGKVLAAGGVAAFSAHLSSVEVFDPSTSTWTTRAPMAIARRGHVAARLRDGRVLVAGGQYIPTAMASGDAEIYNPATDTWTAAPAMSLWRMDAISAVLPSGEVLVAGGVESLSSASMTMAESYDSTTNKWTKFTDLPVPASHGDAVVFPDGSVLVTGIATQSQLWDPATLSWKTAAIPTTHGGSGALVSLPGGKALIAGGYGSGSPLRSSAQASIYDRATNSWTATGDLLESRSSFNLAPVAGGLSLAVAGSAISSGTTTPLSTAELFDRATGKWTSSGAISVPRFDAASAVLPSGAVLVAGGTTTAGAISDATDLYEVCTTGFAADGVCCNTACTGSCQACDVAGSVGTCTALDGAPRPGKSCGGFACSAGACRTTCTTASDCAPGSMCDAGACKPKLVAGATCTSNDACASGFCVDGICCESACSGQCEICNNVTGPGKCVANTPTPAGSRPPCGAAPGMCTAMACNGSERTMCVPVPQNGPTCAAARCEQNEFFPAATCIDGTCPATSGVKCDRFACRPEVGCLKECADNSDCAGGHICRDKGCIPTPTTCSPDRSKSIAINGDETSCAPLLCGDDGKCLKECLSSTDCVGGHSCDVTSKTCTPVAATEDEGGCAMSAPGRERSYAFALALLGGITLARRRRAH